MSEESQELTFSFQLRKPLDVMSGGEVVLVSEIVFETPTSRHLREVSQLKQAFQRGMMEVNEKHSRQDVEVDPENAKGLDEITGEDLMKMLSLSSEPMEDLLEIGMKLLVSGVGTVDGKKFNSTLMQQVTCDEVERMVGEYCRNFIVSSFLKE